MGKVRPRRLPGSWTNARSPRAHRAARPEPVPSEYMGKWLAWSQDMLRILEYGDTLEDVEAKVKAAGLTDVHYQYIPVTGFVLHYAEEGQAEGHPVPKSAHDFFTGGAEGKSV